MSIAALPGKFRSPVVIGNTRTNCTFFGVKSSGIGQSTIYNTIFTIIKQCAFGCNLLLSGIKNRFETCRQFMVSRCRAAKGLWSPGQNVPRGLYDIIIEKQEIQCIIIYCPLF